MADLATGAAGGARFRILSSGLKLTTFVGAESDGTTSNGLLALLKAAQVSHSRILGTTQVLTQLPIFSYSPLPQVPP